MRARRRTGWWRWWPFVLLCVIGGSRWMLSESLPGSASTLTSEALACGSVVALWLLVVPVRRLKLPQRRDLGRAALGGALLIAGPLIGPLRAGGVSAAGLTIALALTPVVLAVAEAAMRGGGEGLAGRLWPGLATVAGLLLVLPQPSLGSPMTDALLILAPVLTGIGAALFCTAEESAWRLPAALAGAAVVFGLGALAMLGRGMAWPPLPGLATGMDALEAVLAVVALGRLAAARWSAQFALVPLVVLVEGLALMRSWVPGRVVGGLVLLALASLAMLLPPAETDEPRLAVGELRERPTD